MRHADRPVRSCNRSRRFAASHGAGLGALLFTAATAVTTATTADAMGLGGYEVQSFLGQPLRMVVQVTAAADETLDPACFKLSPLTIGSDGLPQVSAARVALDMRNGQPRLIITGSR